MRYIQPPVVAAGESLGCKQLDGFNVRVKFYDYGVVSLMLSRPFAGAWSDLVALGQNLIESEQLEQLAADACRRFVRAMWGRGQVGTLAALKDVEANLPFSLLGLDSDNGGEFLNHHVLKWLQKRPQPGLVL
jgi:hypothetical protein